MRVGPWICAALLVFGVYRWYSAREVTRDPGVLATGEPRQRGIASAERIEREGFHLKPRADFDATVRVLRREDYSFGPLARLVPTDFAVGWGPMSDQAVLDHLDISQSNRFFFYQWSGAPPIDPGEITRHAANVHIISANRKVAAAVGRLRPGQLVAMRGYLVNVSGPNGFSWNTSLSRDDTGNGACEVFYVQELLVSNEPLPADYAKIAVATAGVK